MTIMAQEKYSEQEVIFLKKSINLWWIFGILTALLIISVAAFIVFWFCNIEYCRIISILDIISTLLAIILSIFSILYSYNTSQDASTALTSVTNEVVKIEKTHTDLEAHMSTIINALSDKKNTSPALKKESSQEDTAGETTNNTIPS